MKIWVDADACPVVIKDILFRAAERVKIEVILVANQSVQVPRSQAAGMLPLRSVLTEISLCLARLQMTSLQVTRTEPAISL